MKLISDKLSSANPANGWNGLDYSDSLLLNLRQENDTDMKTEINTVDQTRMRALIMERLERPELYADKPLFVWQGVWSDGIQQEVLLHACRDFNRGKDREDWSVFRMTTVSDNDSHLNKPDSKFKGRVAGYLIHTCALSLEHYIHEVDRLI